MLYVVIILSLVVLSIIVLIIEGEYFEEICATTLIVGFMTFICLVLLYGILNLCLTIGWTNYKPSIAESELIDDKNLFAYKSTYIDDKSISGNTFLLIGNIKEKDTSYRKYSYIVESINGYQNKILKVEDYSKKEIYIKESNTEKPSLKKYKWIAPISEFRKKWLWIFFKKEFYVFIVPEGTIQRTFTNEL